MVSVSVFDKISPTALLVAYARQFSDLPYVHEIAQRVQAESALAQFGIPLDDPSRNPLLPLSALIEARYLAVNQLLHQWLEAQAGAGQVIELAAGLLPRGMVMTENPKITYLESDLPAMLEQKQALVQHLVGVRPNLHYQVIDATASPSQFPLEAPYLDRQRPIAVLCEGLLQYLTFPEKERLCANIRGLLQQFGGVWITPDFTTKLRNQGLQAQNNAIRDLFEAIGRETGRSLHDTGFDNHAQVEEFITAQGFQFTTLPLSSVFDQLTCLHRLPIPPAAIQPILASTAVYTLTLCPTAVG
jgi:O-methyltransferase involved in polyketide biosynthesis